MKSFGIALAVVLVLATLVAVSAAAGAGPGPKPPGPGSNPKPSQGQPGTIPPGPGSNPRPSRPRPGANAQPSRRPARPPHRLWYRISLNVVEKASVQSQDQIKWSLVWGADSSSAVIVENVCRVGTRIYQDRCAYAFRGRRKPAGAFDDLAFEAGVNGEYLKLDFTSTRPAFEVIEPPGPFGSDVVRCGAKTTTAKLTKPALYRGTLSAGSLVRDGLGITMGYPAKLRGEITADVTPLTCTRVIARPPGYPAESFTNTQNGSHETWPVLGAPWDVNTASFAEFVPAEIGRALKLRSAAGRFGSSFTMRETLTRTFPGQTGQVEAKVSLVFTLCPRGGRAVRSC